MRWFLALSLAAAAASMTVPKISNPCLRVECRAGRECIVSGGVAQCLCVTQCPDHDRPVCGSDDASYDNYCLLHQRACVSGNHISVDYRGYCKKDIELAMREFGITVKKPLNGVTTHRPVHTITTTTRGPTQPASVSDDLTVCYGPQRDALRDTIISYWQKNINDQPWHTDNMTYKESLSGHFFACDKDRDYLLRPNELISCFDSMPFLPRPEQDLTITRALCIDAMVEEADSNKDWKLDFQEFTYLLDPLIELVAKNCSLEGRDYTDGAEVHVKCNHCVCATGSWVCATHDCHPEETNHLGSSSHSRQGEQFGYMDTKYDLADKKTVGNITDDDDDDYYDDEYDESEESLEDFRDEEAKREYKLLSLSDQKKLNHLENNVKKFYSDVEKMNQLHKADDKDSEDDLDDESDESDEDSEESEISDEEDELLDQYDELLKKSRAVKAKLNSLRTSLSALEQRRDDLESHNHIDRDLPVSHITHDGSVRRDASKHHAAANNIHVASSNDRYHYNHANHNSDHTNDHVLLNTIDHSAKVYGATRKQEKYAAYQAKMDRTRQRSQTDNDMWEDQWKAKIKKHHHTS